MYLLHFQKEEGGGVASATIRLAQYFGKIPPYAILSHTWGAPAHEVTFQDFLGGVTTAQRKKGYQKIEACCVQAIKDGLNHVWIDTCCIDKTSSAELSEAINSMYEWYKDAQLCYAYLEDVSSSEDPHIQDSSFRKSRWFTRGWTLQELIAPVIVNFFAGDWTQIGDKTVLADLIEEITNVDKSILLDRNNLDQASVAQKMSWTSQRHTTRVEDEAYCLFGLFSVNMPTIYGEGRRAFIRLQLEIMRISNDHSIFAWEGDSEFSGMLATSPSQFAHSADYAPMEYADFAHRFGIETKAVSIPKASYSDFGNPIPDPWPELYGGVTIPVGGQKPWTEMYGGVTIPVGGQKPDYMMTNFGLHIQLPVLRISHFDDFYFAFLACTHGADREGTIISLRPRPGRPEGHFYRTVFNNRSLHHAPFPSWTEIYGHRGFTAKTIWLSGNEPRTHPPDFVRRIEPTSRPVRYNVCAKAYRGLDGSAVEIVDVYPPGLVTVSGGGIQIDTSFQTGSWATVIFQHKTSGKRMPVAFGAYNWRLWFSCRYTNSDSSAEQIWKNNDMFSICNVRESSSILAIWADDPVEWEQHSSSTIGNFDVKIFRRDNGKRSQDNVVDGLSVDVRYVP